MTKLLFFMILTHKYFNLIKCFCLSLQKKEHGIYNGKSHDNSDNIDVGISFYTKHERKEKE